MRSLVRQAVRPNRPVNPDARVLPVPCEHPSARAGYWERYA